MYPGDVEYADSRLSDNDKSCVLHIKNRNHQATGDLSADAERGFVMALWRLLMSFRHRRRQNPGRIIALGGC